MKITALFSQSLRSIWSNKLRSGLTILGVVIGVAAVIALVGLGKGLQDSIAGGIGGLGTTQITIQSQNPERTAHRGGVETLTVEDYQAIRKISNIKSASPEPSEPVAITLTADAEGEVHEEDGPPPSDTYIVYGVDTDYFAMNDLSTQSGAFMTDTQINESENVVVIGELAAEELFGQEDPIDQTVFIKGVEFTIIGVLSEPEFTTHGNPAENLYIGYRAWLKLMEKGQFSQIIALAESEEVVDSAVTEIEEALFALRGIGRGIYDQGKANFAVRTAAELLDTLASAMAGFSSVLVSIAAISLLVGGIGVMNIMLVTVTERTREIGLRRAIGAKTRHILLQFLTESVMLTLIGGGLGVLLAVLIGPYVSNTLSSFAPAFGPAGVHGVEDAVAAEIEMIIDPQIILLAAGISVAIGIIFGLSPAIKAAKLDPAEALRYE